MCEFFTFVCFLVRSHHCQTMMVNMAGPNITWASKASVFAKVCIMNQLASCCGSWENDQLQVSPSYENAFFGIKVKKVTITQINVVYEPEQLETNADMGQKEDIQQQRKVLGNKFAHSHLQGLLIDSISELHSKTLSRCEYINFQSWCRNIFQHLSHSDVSLMP